MGVLKKWWQHLFGMIYPRLCEACGHSLVDGEKHLCLGCMCDMPLCTTDNFDDNEIHHKLMRQPIERAAALYYYHKNSPYAKLIQNAKYAARPSLARHFGVMAAERLAATGFFEGIEAIVPVPLYRAKLKKRGYNQSFMIARGINSVIPVPVADILQSEPHSTQTARTRRQRWANAASNYSVRTGEQSPGSHILLVDDVVTTGATLSACASALHAAFPRIRISILVIGLAQQD